MNPKHSSKSANWMTPDNVLEAVRELFGGQIDLDAASDAQANERVGARTYLTDSLIINWPESRSIFLNPPGGRQGRESLTKLFWDKLIYEMELAEDLDSELDGAMKHGHAIFLAFSLEALQTCQDMLAHPICVPRKRLKFVSREPDIKNSPTHANAIVYVPGYIDERERFGEIFSRFGEVRL